MGIRNPMKAPIVHTKTERTTLTDARKKAAFIYYDQMSSPSKK